MPSRVSISGLPNNGLMNKENTIQQPVQGTVIEALPNALFKVSLETDGKEILAYLAGKMRMYRIRVLVGDKVALELDSYGGKARITRRF
jgi:translation initiation factor IF-1